MRLFSYKPARYSVMRVEMAKQKALTGQSFSVVATAPNRVIDWTGDDEVALYELIAKWDDSTGHAGLNALIDDYPFSSGAPNSHHHMDKWTETRTAMESNVIELFPNLGKGTFRYATVARGPIDGWQP